MSDFTYFRNIYDHADVAPLTNQERRAKFSTGLVRNNSNGRVSFLKVVLPDANDSVKEDLQNEVLWNTQVRPQIDESVVRVPRVEKHASGFYWALFEALDGTTIPESQLKDFVHRIAKVCAQVAQVPLGREPNGLSNWVKSRVERFTQNRFDHELSTDLQKKILKIIESLNDSDLQAGMIHGDINLKNLIVGPELEGTIGLVDSEFGTLPSRPEWDKPRFHDAAYFYHLLHCQFHQPELAEEFKRAFREEMEKYPDFTVEDFEHEFQISVLERTISMGNHFPWRTASNKPIEDPRRLKSEPYLELIERSLIVLDR